MKEIKLKNGMELRFFDICTGQKLINKDISEWMYKLSGFINYINESKGIRKVNNKTQNLLLNQAENSFYKITTLAYLFLLEKDHKYKYVLSLLLGEKSPISKVCYELEESLYGEFHVTTPEIEILFRGLIDKDEYSKDTIQNYLVSLKKIKGDFEELLRKYRGKKFEKIFLYYTGMFFCRGECNTNVVASTKIANLIWKLLQDVDSDQNDVFDIRNYYSKGS